MRYRDLQENTTLVATLSGEGELCAGLGFLTVDLAANSKCSHKRVIFGN